jgi:hypothetical protein
MKRWDRSIIRKGKDAGKISIPEDAEEGKQSRRERGRRERIRRGEEM